MWPPSRDRPRLRPDYLTLHLPLHRCDTCSSLTGRESYLIQQAAAIAFILHLLRSESSVATALHLLVLANSIGCFTRGGDGGPGAKRFRHGPGLGDAATRRKWWVAIEDLTDASKSVNIQVVR